MGMRSRPSMKTAEPEASEADNVIAFPITPKRVKNPAAVALGKLGGAKLLGERYIFVLDELKDVRRAGAETIEIEDLIPVPLAVRAANEYLKELTALRVEASPELDDEKRAVQA